jgi:hypothetical protein
MSEPKFDYFKGVMMKINNNMEVQIQIEIQLVALKVTSWRTIGGKETKKAPNSYDVWIKQTYFWANKRLPIPCSL